MDFIKRLLFKWRCKKLLASDKEVKEKVKYLINNLSFLPTVKFNNVDSHALLMHTANIEELVEFMVQMNNDVQTGHVNKPIPTTRPYQLGGNIYFRDSTSEQVPFDRIHCKELFNREFTTYLKQLNKIKHDVSEIDFYTRRHGQVIEDIIELLRTNL